jgi:OTU domain-containing protein 5
MRIPVGQPWPAPSGGSSSNQPNLPPPHAADDEPHNSDDELGIEVDLAARAAQERAFEQRLAQRGLELKRMLQDGNCLFRSVADRVYGDPEVRSPASAKLPPLRSLNRRVLRRCTMSCGGSASTT